MFGLFCAFASSLFVATVGVSSRALKHVATPVVTFYHSIVGIIVFSVVIITQGMLDEFRFSSYTEQQKLLMVIGSLFDTLAIYSTTVAFQSDSSGFVALLSYLTVVYSFVADQVIFHEEF